MANQKRGQRDLLYWRKSPKTTVGVNMHFKPAELRAHGVLVSLLYILTLPLILPFSE